MRACVACALAKCDLSLSPGVGPPRSGQPLNPPQFSLNDSMAVFMTPASLVYSLIFGFSFAGATDKCGTKLTIAVLLQAFYLGFLNLRMG